jgi:BlaI family transcriptional regulator, penicillinase repressor
MTRGNTTKSNMTKSNAATSGAPLELGDLERDVMQLLWSRDCLTADALRELLAGLRPRQLKDSTVRTVLRRLEEKGYVAHTVDGRTFVYRAREPRSRVAAKAVKHIVDWFCNGSLDEVLVGMVDSAMLDRRQMQILAERIEKARIEAAKRGRK